MIYEILFCKGEQMKYKILRTEKAEQQLRDIIFYIADDSKSIDIVLNYLDKIGHVIT